MSDLKDYEASRKNLSRAHSMLEGSERMEYETVLNDRVQVDSDTLSAQAVWTSTCDSTEYDLKSRSRNRARSKSRNRNSERPRSLEALDPKKRDKSRMSRHRKPSRSLTPTRGGRGDKQGSAKSVVTGTKNRKHHSIKSRSKSKSQEDERSVEDSIVSSTRRGRRGLGSRQEPSSCHHRSRSRDGLNRSRDQSADDSRKKGSSKSLDAGSKHRSRHTKTGKDGLESRSTHSHSNHEDSHNLDAGSKHRSRHTKSDKDGLDSRSTHSHSKNKSDVSKSLDEGSKHRSRHTKSGKNGLDSRSNHSHSSRDGLNARSAHSSKSRDRERDDIETKRIERRARSKLQLSSAEEVGYNRSRSKSRDDAYSKSKERRSTRAVRPGAEPSPSYRSFEDAKELRHRSRPAGLGALSTSSSSNSHDRAKEKMSRHSEESHRARLRTPERSLKMDLSPQVHGTQPTESFALAAEAVDEDMNAKMIKEQVQEVLNKMTNTKTHKADLDDTIPDDSGSDTECKDPPRCHMTGPRMCVLALVLIVAGVVGGFAAFRAANPVKPVRVDVPTDSPTTTLITPSPTNLSPINKPPSKNDCGAIQNQLPVVGQAELDVVSFDIQMEILVDDEGNFAGTMASIILTIERNIIPALTGCTQGLQRRLREKRVRFLRQLEDMRYPIANAKVTGSYDDGESCIANMTSPNVSCRTLTLTVDTFAKEGADISEIVVLIEDAVSSKILEERLDLPGNATIGKKEVFARTSAPTYSSMPSVTTLAPTMTSSPSTSPSENPTRAPVTSTKNPSDAPSNTPTIAKSGSPTEGPSNLPSHFPTETPSASPSSMQTTSPSATPSASASASPSARPSASPSMVPTVGVSQSEALMALYNGANGSFASASAGWQNTGDECSWSYVTCDGDGKVASLILTNQGMSGTISSHIGSLTALTFLTLGDNVNIAGTIPTAIGRLTGLLFLGLHGNMLTGTIPTEILNLASLRALGLQENQLTGVVPQLRFSTPFEKCVVSNNLFSDVTNADSAGCLSR